MVCVHSSLESRCPRVALAQNQSTGKLLKAWFKTSEISPKRVTVERGAASVAALGAKCGDVSVPVGLRGEW